MRRRYRMYDKIDAAFKRDWRSDAEIWASVPRQEKEAQQAENR